MRSAILCAVLRWITCVPNHPSPHVRWELCCRMNWRRFQHLLLAAACPGYYVRALSSHRSRQCVRWDTQARRSICVQQSCHKACNRQAWHRAMILIWKWHFNFCHFCRSKTCLNRVDTGNFHPDEIGGSKPTIACWPCRRLVVPLSERSLQHYALCSVRFFNGVISPHQECFSGETMVDLLCFVYSIHTCTINRNYQRKIIISPGRQFTL